MNISGGENTTCTMTNTLIANPASGDHEGGDGDTAFDAVGDVINYTIVATNDGNVTLANVDGDGSEGVGSGL